jgi:large subunit ribosomal protein L13
MNCYQAKAGELAKQWYVIDASGQVVGRLAAQIAPILMGKHRPTYTPHIDTGDYVIVTNVEKVVFTGNKWQEKSYQRYSGYPGGQREETAKKLLQRHPERILQLAIQRMMPKSKLGRHMMDKLKLYVGADYPHQAQRPVPLEPLSGRPASAGALFAPPPTPHGAREIRKAIAKLEAKIQEKSDEIAAAEQDHAAAKQEHEQVVAEAERRQETMADSQEPASTAVEHEPAATPVDHPSAAVTALQEPATPAPEPEPAAATVEASAPAAGDHPHDQTAPAHDENASPPESEDKAPVSAVATAEPTSPE